MSETIIVAIITACAASLPGIINTILNNKNSITLKKYENFNEQRQKVIFDFLESVGQCSGGGITAREQSNYQICLNKLLLYFPNINKDLLDKIYKSLFVSSTSDKLNAITPLIKELSTAIIEKQ